MLYFVIARFKPDTEAHRTELTQDFGEHMRQPLMHIRLVGALRDEQGARTGVLLIMEAQDRDQLERFLQASPYRRAGLYRSVDVEVLEIEAGGLK